MWSGASASATNQARGGIVVKSINERLLYMHRHVAEIGESEQPRVTLHGPVSAPRHMTGMSCSMHDRLSVSIRTPLHRLLKTAAAVKLAGEDQRVCSIRRKSCHHCSQQIVSWVRQILLLEATGFWQPGGGLGRQRPKAPKDFLVHLVNTRCLKPSTST